MIKSRRSMRLKDHDYTQGGYYYFITICTQDFADRFGKIINGQMQMNKPGYMILDIWNELPNRFVGIELDEYVIMPNHLHAIIHVGAPLVGARNSAPHRAGTRPAPTLTQVIGAFKSITTKKYIDGIKNNHWRPFIDKLWQRSFHDHIIRNDSSLDKIRQYILDNPINWPNDPDNNQLEANYASLSRL